MALRGLAQRFSLDRDQPDIRSNQHLLQHFPEAEGFQQLLIYQHALAAAVVGVDEGLNLPLILRGLPLQLPGCRSYGGVESRAHM